MGLQCVGSWKGHHQLNSPLMVSSYYFVITWVMALMHLVLGPHPLVMCLVMACIHPPGSTLIHLVCLPHSISPIPSLQLNNTAMSLVHPS